ncbi:hypothetical protein [Streptomyces sp. NPDC058254]
MKGRASGELPGGGRALAATSMISASSDSLTYALRQLFPLR